MAEFGAAELRKLTVPELQQELKRRGLKKSGVKSKLIQRLLEHIQKYGSGGQAEEQAIAVQPTPKPEQKRHIIEVPHPYNAEYEQQLENDSNISVDEYLNPMFAQSLSNASLSTGPTQEEQLNQESEAPNDSSVEKANIVIDARDFAEEFTEPIHQPLEELKNNERIIEVPKSPQLENDVIEKLDEMPQQHQSMDLKRTPADQIENAAFSALHNESHENEGSNLSFPPVVDLPYQESAENVEIDNKSHQIDDNETSHSGDKNISGDMTTFQNENNTLEEIEQNDDLNKKEEEEEEEQEKNNAVTDALHFGDDVLDYSGIDDSATDDVIDDAEAGKVECNKAEVQEEVEDSTIGVELSEDIDAKVSNTEEIVYQAEQNDEHINNDEGEVSTNIEDSTIDDENTAVHEIDDEFMGPAKPKKAVVPVALKKRVSLNASSDSAEEKAAKRKRRWGSTSIKDSAVTISTDSIKKLIPDVKVDASVLENVPELDYQEEDDVEVINKEDCQEDRKKQTRSGRTVTLDSAKKIVLGKSPSKDTVVIDSDSGEAPKQIRTHSIRPLHVDDDAEEQVKRDKSPSPARNPPSCYLHVRNLVRPYTVPQLKALIQRSGTIKENKFWINNIKSHCYVMLSSEDEAVATREAMHGLNWPSGSTKNLTVDFAVMQKMFDDTSGALGEEPTVVIEIDDKENESTNKDKKGKSDSGRRTVDEERKRRHERSQRHGAKDSKHKEKEKKREESPAKLLDDLFRKTKATPCIYWLPLTDAQVLEREKKEETKARDTPQVATNQSSNARNFSDRNDRRRPSPYRRPPQNRDRSWR